MTYFFVLESSQGSQNAVSFPDGESKRRVAPASAIFDYDPDSAAGGKDDE